MGPRSPNSTDRFHRRIGARPSTLPTTLPQFEDAIKPVQQSSGPVGPSTQERLTEFVLRNRRLSPTQVRMPWTFLGITFAAPGPDGKHRANHGVEITGVVIPADGEHPSYRVMVADMDLAKDEAA
jgi:hypothetical protein